MGEKHFKAAVEQQADHWVLVDDDQQILAAKDPIFVDNVVDLALALHERYLRPDGSSSLCVVGHDLICTDSGAFHPGNDPVRLAALVRTYDNVFVPEANFAGLAAASDKYVGYKDRYGLCRFWEPPRAPRRKPRPAFVRAGHLRDLARDLRQALLGTGIYCSANRVGNNVADRAAAVLQAVILINHLHGRNAHRRLKEFQDFCGHWRVGRANLSRQLAACPEFTAWMDAETRARKPQKIVPISNLKQRTFKHKKGVL